MISQYGPVICGCSSEECRLNGCRVVRENMQTSHGLVPLPKQIEYKQEDVGHLQARATAYDKMLPKYISMQDELEELRELRLQAYVKNGALKFADAVSASIDKAHFDAVLADKIKLQNEVKELRELCGELAQNLFGTYYGRCAHSVEEELYIEKLLAKAKERLGK